MTPRAHTARQPTRDTTSAHPRAWHGRAQRIAGGAALLVAALLAGCASSAPPAAWQARARSAIDSAVEAQLGGDARLEALDLARARDQVARTGRAELMARVELMHCAAHVARLAFGPCAGYERLRADAAPAEQAYAAHLNGERLGAAEIALLPAPQRAAAAAVASNTPPRGAVPAADANPLSRLIATAVLFRAGLASPAAIAAAVDTASTQGWRRPLLAWLAVQVELAERAGDGVEAARLRRRMALATNTPPR